MGIPITHKSSNTTVFEHYGEGAPRTGYQVYNALLAWLDGNRERKLGPIRKVVSHSDLSIGLVLHFTEVVNVRPDGTIRLEWGGWHTLLTNSTITDFLPVGWSVSGHSQLVVQRYTTRPNPDPNAREWERTLYEHTYYPVPLHSTVTITPRGIVYYTRHGKRTRAQVVDDQRRAERLARKLNGEED